MDRLELGLEALAPDPRGERHEEECQQATGIGWIEPDEVPRRSRWVLMLGVDPDDETLD